MFKFKSKINSDRLKFIPNYYKILGVICSVVITFFGVYLFVHAGNIDSPAIPATDTGRMYTLEQIYQKFYNGTVATKQSGGFTEPGSAPGSTMHTLDNIYDNFSTDVAAANAVAADVLSTKTFFATTGTTRGTNWGPTTGTMANNGAQTITPTTTNTAITAGYHNGSGYCAGDANLTAGNIKIDTPIFGVTGIYAGSPPAVPVTGQTTATYGTSRTCADGGTGTCEDGYYKTGAALSYADVEVNSQYVAVNDANTSLMWQKCSAGLSDTNKADTCATGTATTLAWKTAGAVTEAINYCENLRLCNDGTYQGDKTTEGDCTAHSGDLYVNWRLPNIKELFTLTVEEAGAIAGVKAAGAPYINQTAFPNTVSNSYWSSSTLPSDTTRAFTVYFNLGGANGSTKTTALYVRCVRGQ